MRARKISTGWGTRLPTRSTRSSRRCVIPFEAAAVWFMRVVTSRARRAATCTIRRGCPRSAQGPGRQKRAGDHRRSSRHAEALGEGGEDGAERLRLRTLGAAGPSTRVPGEDVQVCPRDILRDELLEEQGPDHGAGLLRHCPDVVEVGDLAIELLAVGPPEG